MKFKRLTLFLQKLEATPSRIEITKILSLLFRESGGSEIDKIVNLILGQLAPSYKGIVFNIAERMMLKVLASAYKVELGRVREVYKREGDLGNVAEKLAKPKRLKKPVKSSQSLDNGASGKTKKLDVNDVYERLVSIAEDEGEKSQERKIQNFAGLLSGLDPLSARYVARIPVGRLRLGFSDKTILDALSWMETGDKSKKEKLERAYQVVPDVGILAKKVKEVGADRAVAGVKPIVGVPVLPMLAQRLKKPTEMIEKMGKVFVEPKFDGLRVLIHFKRLRGEDFVKAFTRNLNGVADMFPELVEIGKYVNARDLILDTEAVGMDPQMLRLADFQTTMRRRRKYDIETKAKSIPLRFQVFDIILKDSKSLMDIPYYLRRKILEKTIKKGSLLVLDEAILTDEAGVIIKEHKKKIKEGLEGVIIKRWDTPYIPGRTGWRWVKMKEEEAAVGKLADTVDCIVMGYSGGRGKRASFGLGQFLVGVRDKDEIKTITKVGTGLTDEQFRELKKRLSGLEVKEKPKNYLVHKLLEPDFWVEPEAVVEIAADEITKSPTHSAGLALRFPRLVKFRDDKSPKEATTVAEVKKLFEMQKI